MIHTYSLFEHMHGFVSFRVLESAVECLLDFFGDTRSEFVVIFDLDEDIYRDGHLDDEYGKQNDGILKIEIIHYFISL